MSQMIEVKCTKHSKVTTSPTDVTTTNAPETSAVTDPSNSTSEGSPLPQQKNANDDAVDNTEDEEQELVVDELRPLRLQLTPESQLDSTEPVCVDLLDCTASVSDVLKWLTSASWYDLSVCLSVCHRV